MNDLKQIVSRVEEAASRAEAKLTCFLTQHQLICYQVRGGFQFVCRRCGEPYSPTLSDRARQFKTIVMRVMVRLSRQRQNKAIARILSKILKRSPYL